MVLVRGVHSSRGEKLCVFFPLCGTEVPRFGLFKPFADYRRAGVDADEVGPPRAVVGELVRYTGGRDHDVARSSPMALVAELKGDIAFVDHPGLVVRVTM
jgi:hypothetical protein